MKGMEERAQQGARIGENWMRGEGSARRVRWWSGSGGRRGRGARARGGGGRAREATRRSAASPWCSALAWLGLAWLGPRGCGSHPAARPGRAQRIPWPGGRVWPARGRTGRGSVIGAAFAVRPSQRVDDIKTIVMYILNGFSFLIF